MISDKPIVFLGPSLSQREAERILDAEYHPPLRAGDLDLIKSPAIVGVVDGVLEESARLPISEARRAIHRGIKCFGAASVGALLAIDLSAHGFQGVGQVFEFLRAYRGNKEDLVIALYAEHDNTLLTIPIIDIVLSQCHPTRHAAEDLVGVLCRIPLQHRTWNNIQHRLRSVGWLTRPLRTSAKSGDARMLLRPRKMQARLNLDAGVFSAC